jgi:hypothetical protein
LPKLGGGGGGGKLGKFKEGGGGGNPLDPSPLFFPKFIYNIFFAFEN